ncbi:unnamed protein product [Diabrotica balteata]|uniref:UmuC domain-containing protein n=1 Tax=Diabrotica balteata TaxID=107213 RepID=A0A9N9SQD8_DIABA|nr:unnamed protein product [Diabrotica balteata]
MEMLKSLEDHSRTIIHIDIDCFYAQVEMIKNPKLRQVPLGIQQKNIIVTTNYIARSQGVNKCVLVSEALKQCPNMVLVNGEDLHDYRQKSYEVTALLQNYSRVVERLGLDENFIDVTELVSERIENVIDISTIGNIFGDDNDSCDCGCTRRLQIGTTIAQEIRDKIKSELQLTTSAGIGHNKLLAKIVGSVHKPDQQTVVFPQNGVELMLSLSSVSKITGIGYTLSEQLKTVNIVTVEDLQKTNFTILSDLLGPEKAKLVQTLSFGIDETIVKSSGKPQSIGIEDSCRALSAEKEVREKLEHLLNRLIILLVEDGRLPKTIKLTIRRFDREKKRSSTRETKQCNISPSLFNTLVSSQLPDNNIKKIMTVIMHLFNKLVDPKKPYHLTLLGLAFTKFLEKPATGNILTNFIKKDIEVQSVTDIHNNVTSSTLCKTVPATLIIPPECDIEPPSKKYKLSHSHLDSPTDLPVAALHLSSDAISFDISSTKIPESTDDSESSSSAVNNNLDIKCPPNVDHSVFQELPCELQNELWEEYKRDQQSEKRFQKNKRFKSNNILNYFTKM